MCSWRSLLLILKVLSPEALALQVVLPSSKQCPRIRLQVTIRLQHDVEVEYNMD